MSCPPPPPGLPWHPNVGGNPNINRDPPPAPLELAPAGFPAPFGFPPMHMGPPMCFPGAPPPPLVAPAPPPPPPAPAPVPFCGWAQPPPPYGGYAMPAGIWGPPAVPAPAPAEDKDSTTFPGGRDPGISLLYPDSHCIFHHLLGPTAPWDLPGGLMHQLDFNKFYVDTNWTVAYLIERVRNGEDSKGWAITEAMESGNGKWGKGTTIAFEGDKGKQTLKEVGWTGKRGRELPVVWCYVHRV